MFLVRHAVQGKFSKILLIALVATVALPVLAEQQWCAGTLNGSYVGKGGDLYIKGTWAANWTQVCHLNTAWKGIPAETCQEWHSMIQTAVISQSSVVAYYSDAPPCNELPYYGAAPGPGYFMLRSQ